ncbi:MAG: ATPase [Betaproteobacteria bacterium RBG_16_56_24]|nr:MAG: ATPase [Betaproteobacteria bacterium RBG_16_56_24]
MSAAHNDQSILGLSAAEAQQRLAASGYNELSPPQRRRLWHIVADVLREPMFLLLIAAGGIYLLLGSIEDALMLLFFVALIVTLTVFQQRKSERVLEALRDLSSPRALVLRDGKQQRIAGREVVAGDLLLLTEGDRVAADAVLLSCNDLLADESMLTGESVPVRKQAGSPDAVARQPGGDDQPFVYAGTVLVQGSGIGLVTATGKSSAIGQIGRSLEDTRSGASPLRIQTDRLVRRLAIFAGALCLLLMLAYGISRGNWLDALLAGISLAMASLPEEFPVILSVFMALGAWRISRRNVLTRRLDAIETLGATTVLCTDKTGTLTENRMVIRKLYSGGQMHQVDSRSPLPEPWHELVEFGILASERDPFDPMERALHELGRRTLTGTEHLHHEWELVHEYSLSPDLLAMSHVWQGDEQKHHMVAAKGAPEAIVDLCHLPEAQAKAIEQAAAGMADQGLRVLGVARAELEPSRQWPAIQHDIEFAFVGLLGLQDPLRADVPEAIAQCRAAGIRVVMITGDHARTAQAIAAELGLLDVDRQCGQVLTGSELDALSDQALRSRLSGMQVFARIVPQQKLRLVEAFKANGEIVAMTGDGVNDAPALKAAHIGVAMGKRGTDVAREAAGLVLLNDDFASLAATIRLGRRIYDNLRKAMSYTLAVHVPIVGMALLPALTGQPLLLLPAHIMFLELIIDPACSIFFEAEPEERDIMQRPPRQANETLFGGKLLTNSLLQGVIAFAIAAATYAWALSKGWDENSVRALVFVSMVAGNIALVFSNRSLNAPWQGTWSRENPVLWWIVLGGSAGLALTLSVPVLRELFHFSGDSPHLLGIGVLATLGVLLLGAGVKRILP